MAAIDLELLITLTEALAALVQRVGAVEGVARIPGPPGEPGQPGADGAPGRDAEPITDEQIKAAATEWLAANITQPADGRDGVDGRDGRDADPITAEQIQLAVDLWFEINRDSIRGADGRNGRDGRDGADGQKGADGRNGTNGQDGANGSDGIGIDRIEQPNEDTARAILTDGREYDLTLPRGKDGITQTLVRGGGVQQGGGGGGAVESVNGQTGVVVLTAADVGAEVAGAVAAHESASDPHPQYTTAAEASAAAPVQSVNAKTGVVVLTTTDVAEGDRLYLTAQRVRDTVLTGLSLATNAVISATDSVLSALGKLQKQITDNLATLSAHIANTSNPHNTTAAQVGADPAGTAAAAITDHEALADPHPQYLTQAEGDTLYQPIGGGGGSAAVPTYVQPGEVYTVEADTQALFRKRIKLGSGARIKLKGILVGV